MKRAGKIILTIILIVVILGGGAFAAYKLGFIGQKDDELKIDKTANVVTSIKKISELVTMNYYEEFLLTKKRKRMVVLTDEIVIIAKGNVRAGFNLAKIQDEDVKVTGDTLLLTLPPAEVLDVTINPSGFDVFVEDGEWSHDEVTAIEDKGIAQLRASAIKAGVLEKAEKNGIEQLTNMYKAFGFKEVVCTIKQ